MIDQFLPLKTYCFYYRHCQNAIAINIAININFTYLILFKKATFTNTKFKI